MRHLKKGRKFGRERNQRRALLKSLASSFFMLGRIKTTEAKAKELRSHAEPFITRAKNPTLVNRRYLARFFDERTAKKVFERANEFKNRQGGYTRIIKSGRRTSDGARMAIIEFVK
ncbi:MAG: 50S ribosomal protein L17 [Candidatus Sungiibacteriota bacterium]|uniref:50S ribosomal protein L17 n=1 Tax=Candidatus Sungiibacteriota bacterium TaxID=2750080 RepID=A0A7T5URZ2_9BACT|nr:MAG: 50S ribosomal protein L17 [Candidatus Sungbacteria bacterium]